jgi:hypothetical protein
MVCQPAGIAARGSVPAGVEPDGNAAVARLAGVPPAEPVPEVVAEHEIAASKRDDSASARTAADGRQ